MNSQAVPDVVRAVIVGKGDVMRYYDPERIQRYCRSCDKYGQFWSCPPFENSPFAELPEWQRAVLVTLKTRVDSGFTKDELIAQFQASRQRLGERMLGWEKGPALAVVAGHCFGCTTCTRLRGVPCCLPSRMRYSLGALGFDVSGLVEGAAGQRMHWPASGMPDYLLIVGALLCPSADFARQIVRVAE